MSAGSTPATSTNTKTAGPLAGFLLDVCRDFPRTVARMDIRSGESASWTAIQSTLSPFLFSFTVPRWRAVRR
jgi:hypothetical protein